MCAIAGELNTRGGAADPRVVTRMAEAMAARGPDGHGTLARAWVALSHRRLKVIDLSERAAQPMRDPELGITVAFNGCIYNHAELRDELRDEFTPATRSDTEVILHAYARWGTRFVEHLVGMFAIAVFDERRDRVVLARDRLGIKPLYVSEVPGRIRFASTLPGLLAGGDVDTTLDPVAVHHYLTWHSIVPAPHTLLTGVRKLPPATVRVIEADGRSREWTYWEPAYARVPERSDWSADDWSAAIEESLRTAVRRRLVADVPVGVLLSGGLDSSLLVALAAAHSPEPLHTFSIGFTAAGGETGDEFRYSDRVAEQYGTQHHQMRIGEAELAAAIPDAIAAMTEPMASHDVTAFYLLAQATAPHVSVVQSGQGADEVFAGYGYHGSAAGAARTDAAAQFRAEFHDRSHAEVGALLRPPHRLPDDASRGVVDAHLAQPGAETAVDAVLRFDTHVLMPDDPVKRVDSMTMSAGLEARVPFLDQDLVELAASCPPELKTRHGGKGVLKEIGRRVLPRDVVDRPKGYFPVPGLRHLDGDVLGTVTDAMTSPEARRRGLLSSDAVAALLADPNGASDQRGGNALWSLAVLEMWCQEHGVRA